MTPLQPVPLEPGELPSSYGKNTLVLLPVDPYLLHAYWELPAAPMLSAARTVLRFYEAPLAGEESRPFDVEVSLGAGNWYVPLWSPEKVYYADLGLRGDDGSFQSFARSNTVVTPAAWPKDADYLPENALPESALPENALTNALPEPVDPDPEAADGIEPVAEPEAPEALEPLTAATESLPPPPIDAAARLRHRLAELYATRGELPPLHEPWDFPIDSVAASEPDSTDSSDSSDSPDSPLPFALDDLQEIDLTQYSEERFTPGISSVDGPIGR